MDENIENSSSELKYERIIVPNETELAGALENQEIEELLVDHTFNTSNDGSYYDQDTFSDFNVDEASSYVNKPINLFNGNLRNSLPDLRQDRIVQRLRLGILDGPQHMVEPHVSMIFSGAQQFPDRLRKAIPHNVRCLIIWTFVLLWLSLFIFLAKNSLLADGSIDGEHVSLIGCEDTWDVWRGKDEICGINGSKCGALTLEEFKFKCPASCKTESFTYSPRAVGSYGSIYRPFVVGGNNSYRGDSFICASGIHNGAISNRFGGCGRITFKGITGGFPETKGFSGIWSIPFDSLFPASYSFDSNLSSESHLSGCYDLRAVIITVNITLSAIFGYFVGNAKVFFWTLIPMGFWTVILASNPPLQIYSEIPAAELISLGFGRFLPGMLGAYVIYVSSSRPLLKNLEANLSRSIFWTGGFWIGILENYVFSSLPLDRLTVHDLNAQKGAWAALITIIGLIFAIAIGQIYIIWRVGKLRFYLSVYGCFALTLILLYMIPSQVLRLHHYIFALILLPGTGFKTTPALFYQGLLVGLYISGISRWGFDSILQTVEQLRRGEATLIGGIPSFFDPLVKNYQDKSDPKKIQDIIIRWPNVLDPLSANFSEQVSKMWNGYSLIVNDVEQYRGPNCNFSLSSYIHSPLWVDEPTVDMGGTHSRKTYLRLAFAKISDSTRTGGKHQLVRFRGAMN